MKILFSIKKEINCKTLGTKVIVVIIFASRVDPMKNHTIY